MLLYHQIMISVAGILATAGIAFAIYWSVTRRPVLLLVSLAVIAVNGVGGWQQWRMMQIKRDLADCADAPKRVPYHDGMTLCPGQSAIMTIEIPVPEKDRGI